MNNLVYQPMLAELAPGAFDSARHIFEPKWDGVRCLVYIGSALRLVGRRGADLTAVFPELALADFRARAHLVLDGEMICGKGDRASFALVQQRIHKQDAFAVRLASRLNPAIYMAFDILELEGADLTSSGKALPLWEREKLLAASLTPSPRVHLTPFLEAEGMAAFQAWSGAGYEGVMAKDLHASYVQGKRSPAWLKIKVARVGEFYAVALTPGEGSRQASFGALVLASLEGGAMVYRGEVGSGFSEAGLKTILDQARDAPASLAITIKGARWIAPLKVRVKYLDETEDGKLRFPVFLD